MLCVEFTLLVSGRQNRRLSVLTALATSSFSEDGRVVLSVARLPACHCHVAFVKLRHRQRAPTAAAVALWGTSLSYATPGVFPGEPPSARR